MLALRDTVFNRPSVQKTREETSDDYYLQIYSPYFGVPIWSINNPYRSNFHSKKYKSSTSDDQANAKTKGCKYDLRIVKAPCNEIPLQFLCFSEMWFFVLPVHFVEYIFNFDEARLTATILLMCWFSPLLLYHFIGLYYFLVALFMEWVVGVAIWVVLQRELLECFLDLLLAGTRRHSQFFIGIEYSA